MPGKAPIQTHGHLQQKLTLHKTTTLYKAGDIRIDNYQWVACNAAVSQSCHAAMKCNIEVQLTLLACQNNHIDIRKLETQGEKPTLTKTILEMLWRFQYINHVQNDLMVQGIGLGVP